MKKQNFTTKVISIFLSLNLLLSNLLYPFTILAREANEDDYYSQPQVAETSSSPQQQEVPYEEVYNPPPAAEPPAYPTPQYQQEIPYEETHPAPPPPASEPQVEAPQPTYTPSWVEPERQQEVAYEEVHPAPTPQSFASVNPPPLVDDPSTQQAAVNNYNYQGSSYQRDYDNAYSEVRAELTPQQGGLAQNVAQVPAAALGFGEDLSNSSGNVVSSAFETIKDRRQRADEDRLDKKLAEANTSFDQAATARSKEIDEYINAPDDKKAEALAQVWNIPPQTSPDQAFTKLGDEHKAFGINLQGTFANFTISIGLQQAKDNLNASTDLANRANLGFTPAGIGLNVTNFFVNHLEVAADLATFGYASIKNKIDEINRDAASLEPARNAIADSFLANPATGYDHTGDAAVLTYETEIKAEILNGTYHSVEEALAANSIRANVLKYWGATPSDIQNFVNASGDTREKLDEYYKQQVNLARRDADAAYELAATTALNLAGGPAREAVQDLAVAGARVVAPKVKTVAGNLIEDILKGGKPVWSQAEDGVVDCVLDASGVLGISYNPTQEVSKYQANVLGASTVRKCRVRSFSLGKSQIDPTRIDPKTGKPYINDDAVILGNESGNLAIGDGVSGGGGGYTASRPAVNYASGRLDRIPIDSDPNEVLVQLHDIVHTGAPKAIAEAGGTGQTTFSVAKYVETGDSRNIVMSAVGDIDHVIVTADGQVRFVKSGYAPGPRDTSNPGATINASRVIVSPTGVPGYTVREGIIPVKEGDLYFVAGSDAVVDFNVLNDPVLMKRIVVEAAGDPQKFAQLIVDSAKKKVLSGLGNKKVDDTSVVVMDLRKLPAQGAVGSGPSGGSSGKLILPPAVKQENASALVEGKWVDPRPTQIINRVVTINQAVNKRDLFQIIDSRGGVQGSQQFYSPATLKDLINKYEAGDTEALSKITRNEGLRDAVRRVVRPRQSFKIPNNLSNPLASHTSRGFWGLISDFFQPTVFAQESNQVDSQATVGVITQTAKATKETMLDIKQELSQGGKITSDEIKSKLLNNMKLTAHGSKYQNEIIVSTGPDGTVEFEIDPATYDINVAAVPGATIQTSNNLIIKANQSKVLTIGINQGNTEVTYLNNSDDVVKNQTGDNPAKLKIVTFYDKNNNSNLDDNEKAVPWGGVTVTLTKVDKEHIIFLDPGWNLVTLSALPDKALNASALLTEIAKQGGYATTVSTLSDGSWTSYVKRGDNDYSGDDFTIEVGKAYFVKVLKPIVYKYGGQELVAPLKTKLTSGWNAVGLPKTKKIYKASEIIDEINTKNGGSDAVSRWQLSLWDTLVKKQEQKYGKDFLLENNKGYLIRLEKEGEFEL